MKSGVNIFKIYPLVALPSEYNDINLVFSTWILMAIESIKCAFIYDRLFSIDRNDTHISFSLCWKLMTGW